MSAPMLLASPEQIEQFCRSNQVAYLAVFGSASRGSLRPDSDIDLLVAFAPGARVGFLALARMQRELSALFHRPIDLVPRDGLKPTIRESILADAQTLYAV
jgi:predicted nucleotidyltransferase